MLGINNLIWTEGRNIIIILLIVMIVGGLVWHPLFYLGLVLLIWTFYFFRDPERHCIMACSDDSVILCPADGRVVDIVHISDKSLEDNYSYKISIFLSAFDVHVNRMPIAGKIIHTEYKPGAFKLAFLPKSSHLNEYNDIAIRDNNGRKILVRQIAGFVARRIRCWIKKGMRLQVGQRYGMIRFGSRVDVFLPACVMIKLKKGQYVFGGQTILGRWRL